MAPTLPFSVHSPRRQPHGRRCLSWITSNARCAGYLAAVSLVAVQVGSGVLLKAAQHDGRYDFSPSGSVAISECIKMLISLALFYRECRRRAAAGVPPSYEGFGPSPTYASLEEDEHRPSLALESESDNEDQDPSPPLPKQPIRLDFGLFWNYIRGEIPMGRRYGFANLALLYMLINNVIFVCYELADPATIQLLRGGMTFITALLSIVLLRTSLSKLQWTAIVFQVCGLTVSQYHPSTGSAYPIFTYLVILFQVILGAGAGVYNQYLLKSHASSLHAGNFYLYAFGVGINLVAHVALFLFRADEPNIVAGYNNIGAVLVVANNVLLGLVISVVYKYADAVIKCFAGAIATGILIYISVIFFGTELSFVVIPGTIVIFTASWLYVDGPVPTPSNREKSPGGDAAGSEDASPTLQWLLALRLAWQRVITFVSSISAVAAIVLLTLVVDKALAPTTDPAAYNITTLSFPPFSESLDNSLHRTHSPGTECQQAPSSHSIPHATHGGHASHGSSQKAPADTPWETPFKDTVLVLRWNSQRPDHDKLRTDYSPFFHTVHMSIPNSLADQEPSFYNATHDQFPTAETAYVQLAHLMQYLLDEKAHVSGLIYTPIDDWIHPQAWPTSQFDRPWLLDFGEPAAHGARLGGAHLVCMNASDRGVRDDWWWWTPADLPSTDLLTKLSGGNVGYGVQAGEWCVGGADAYYVPRRFFNDFAFMAGTLSRAGVPHSVALPTMLHAIDQNWSGGGKGTLLERVGLH